MKVLPWDATNIFRQLLTCTSLCVRNARISLLLIQDPTIQTTVAVWTYCNIVQHHLRIVPPFIFYNLVFYLPQPTTSSTLTRYCWTHVPPTMSSTITSVWATSKNVKTMTSYILYPTAAALSSTTQSVFSTYYQCQYTTIRILWQMFCLLNKSRH